MKKSAHSDEPITIGERIATAFVSAIAAGLTIIAYFAIGVALTSRSYSGPPEVLFDIFASNISLYIVAAAFALGFILGSTRMAEVFGSFWGTSEEPEPWLVKLKATIVIMVIALAVVHFAHNP